MPTSDSVVWDENTPLSCLVPTLTGDGAYTTALVDLHVGVHNEFMEKCQNGMKKNQKKSMCILSLQNCQVFV